MSGALGGIEAGIGAAMGSGATGRLGAELGAGAGLDGGDGADFMDIGGGAELGTVLRVLRTAIRLALLTNGRIMKTKSSPSETYIFFQRVNCL